MREISAFGEIRIQIFFFAEIGELVFFESLLCHRGHLLHDQIKRETLSKQVIIELFCFLARLGIALEPDAFCYRRIDQLRFRHLFKG